MRLPIAILAGGLATRLRPVTERIPKSLVEVAGRPFIDRQLALLQRNGFRKVVLCLGNLGEMVREVVGDGGRWAMEVRYSFDGEKLLGTGGALRNALALLGDAFFVLYGDSYLDCDYAGVERAFLASGKKGLMTVLRNDDRWDRSNVVLDEGRIAVYDKENRSPEMHHIDYGLSVLSASALAAYRADASFDLHSVFQGLIGEGQLAGFEVFRRFYEIGSPEGLRETRQYFGGKEGET